MSKIYDEDEFAKQYRDHVNTFRTVLNYMRLIDVCRGVYDPKYRNDSFMQGVKTVMSYIAMIADNYRFIEEFDRNIEESQRRTNDGKIH